MVGFFVGNEMEFHPVANIFPLMEGQPFLELVEDIRANGLREPIVLHPDGRIVDGRNRFRSCKQAGVEPRFDTWNDKGSLVAFIISQNLHRRHLTESQRAMVAARIKPMFEEEARKRQEASRVKPGQQVGKVVANLPPPKQQVGKARDQAAATVNVSPRSVESASKVLRDGASELVDKVDTGKVSVSTAAALAEASLEKQQEIVARGPKEILAEAKKINKEKAEQRRQERMKKLEQVSTGNAPLDGGIGRFPVLYADPPWRYDYSSSSNREIENQYPTMPLEDIRALPVPSVTTDDCILFLWTPSPKLEEAIQVLKAWGFSYRTCAIWDKQKIGMGYYFRQQHELLLVATKGAIPTPLPENRPASVVPVKREGHSEKPDEFYEIIELMYPDLPKLELFARKAREGWTVWGNQAKAA